MTPLTRKIEGEVNSMSLKKEEKKRKGEKVQKERGKEEEEDSGSCSWQC